MKRNALFPQKRPFTHVVLAPGRHCALVVESRESISGTNRNTEDFAKVYWPSLPCHPHLSQSLSVACEQVFLREAFSQATSERGQVVLVGGEAGIGKTTLIRDLIENRDALQTNCVLSKCYDLTNTPPYGPRTDIFASVDAITDAPPVPGPFTGGHLGLVTDQAMLYAEVRTFFVDW